MKRKAVLIPLVLVTVLALAGIGYAAFVSKAKVKGTATSVSDLQWVPSPPPSTNDMNGAPDPLGPGIEFPPARATYNLGDTPAGEGSTADTLTFASTNVYDSYSFTVMGRIAANPSGLVIQRVILTDNTSVAGATRFTAGPTTIEAKLRPSECGRALSSSATTFIEFQVVFADVQSASNYAYSIDLEAVPASAYVPSQCVSW